MGTKATIFAAFLHTFVSQVKSSKSTFACRKAVNGLFDAGYYQCDAVHLDYSKPFIENTSALLFGSSEVLISVRVHDGA